MQFNGSFLEQITRDGVGLRSRRGPLNRFRGLFVPLASRLLLLLLFITFASFFLCIFRHVLTELDINRAALPVFPFGLKGRQIILLDNWLAWNLRQDIFQCIKYLIEINPEILLLCCLLLQKFLELALFFVQFRLQRGAFFIISVEFTFTVRIHTIFFVRGKDRLRLIIHLAVFRLFVLTSEQYVELHDIFHVNFRFFEVESFEEEALNDIWSVFLLADHEAVGNEAEKEAEFMEVKARFFGV